MESISFSVSSAQSKRGRLADLKVKIRGVLLDDEVEQFVHFVAHCGRGAEAFLDS
jgi:hypothetical protein